MIFLFSAQPGLPSPDDVALDFIFKKSAHMFVFGVLYILIWRALQLTWFEQPSKKLSLFAFAICLCYAMADEFHQSLTPGRSPTLRDVGYDTLGMLGGWLWINRYI